MTTATGTRALIDAVTAGTRTVELGQPLFTGMPCSPNHPGVPDDAHPPPRRHGPPRRRLRVQRDHRHRRPRRHPRRRARPRQPGRLPARRGRRRGQRSRAVASREHGAEHIPADGHPRRAARRRRRARASTRSTRGYGVTADDLAAAAERAGVEPRAGDAALVRTGWARQFDDAASFLGHDDRRPRCRPSDGARWLAERGVRGRRRRHHRVRADPARRRALACCPCTGCCSSSTASTSSSTCALEELAAQGLTEFLFVLAPLRIVGGTGSPRSVPLAVVAAMTPTRRHRTPASSSPTSPPRAAADGAARRAARRRRRAASLDVLGNCLAARDAEPARVDRRRRRGAGAGRRQATVARRRSARCPAPSARPGQRHARPRLDFDDTHLPSVLHPSASVVPAALAVAEAVGALRAAHLAAAAAAGVELTSRLGMAGYDEELGNSVFFEHGQHATSICGTVGAARGRRRCSTGWTPTGLTAAIGDRGEHGRRRHRGQPHRRHRQAGPLRLGRPRRRRRRRARRAHGLTGPPTVLEGRFGFLHAFCGERAARRARHRRASASTGSCCGSFFKPYPCNHFTHAGIDAALALRADGHRPPSDVVELDARRRRRPSCARSPSRARRRPARDPGTTRRSAARTPSRPRCSAAAGSAVSSTTSPTTPRPTPPGSRSPRACAASPTTSATAIFPHQFPAVLTARLDSTASR